MRAIKSRVTTPRGIAAPGDRGEGVAAFGTAFPDAPAAGDPALSRHGQFLFVGFLHRNGHLIRNGEAVINDVGLAALALLHGTIDVSGHQLLRFGTAVRCKLCR